MKLHYDSDNMYFILVRIERMCARCRVHVLIKNSHLFFFRFIVGRSHNSFLTSYCLLRFLTESQELPEPSGIVELSCQSR